MLTLTRKSKLGQMSTSANKTIRSVAVLDARVMFTLLILIYETFRVEIEMTSTFGMGECHQIESYGSYTVPTELNGVMR